MRSRHRPLTFVRLRGSHERGGAAASEIAEITGIAMFKRTRAIARLSTGTLHVVVLVVGTLNGERNDARRGDKKEAP